MIPKQAIEKAIEGGWKGVGVIYEVMEWGIVNLGTEAEMSWSDIVLDPTFWQALGKVLGWGNRVWLQEAMNFNKLMLTGGDVEAFWRELLN